MFVIRRAESRDTEAVLRLLVQVNMVHHLGRPDLFKGPATKYSAEELAEMVHSAGKRLIATAMDAEKAYYDCDLEKDAAIIIGNEGNGISPELMMRADEKIMIPMAGNTESLNAAVAAGILMYERIRRR